MRLFTRKMKSLDPKSKIVLITYCFLSKFGSQKLSSWQINDLGEIDLCVNGPDIKNEALDPKHEVSGRQIQNISNNTFFVVEIYVPEALQLGNQRSRRDLSFC